MMLHINLPPETERRLRERAAQTGQSAEAFVRSLVERELHSENGGPPALAASESDTSPPSSQLDRVLAPVREEFERSGMTDDELAALVEDLRQKVWQEKQTRKVP